MQNYCVYTFFYDGEIVLSINSTVKFNKWEKLLHFLFFSNPKPAPLVGFVAHQAVGRTAGNILIRLADSLLLPFNCKDYAESLEDYLNTAVNLYQKDLKAKSISMGK